MVIHANRNIFKGVSLGQMGQKGWSSNTPSKEEWGMLRAKGYSVARDWTQITGLRKPLRQILAGPLAMTSSRDFILNITVSYWKILGKKRSYNRFCCCFITTTQQGLT